ncbi:MAG: sporulation protein [Candidatus Thermoplasmatota archaeon]|nr:sporulation protein [Candidatus Thermoplasmatota archaeon]
MSKLGTSSLKVNMEVPERYIFHKRPFRVIITMAAMDKGVKVNGLTVELFWKEFKMSKRGTFNPYSPQLDSRNEWYEIHVIHRQRTQEPFEIAPNGKFSTELTFTTEKAKNTRFPDRFYLKAHVDIPGAVDIRERMDIEVLPEVRIAAPMIAMVEELGFKLEPWKKGDEDISHRNQWMLIPDRGRYPNFESVLLTVDDPRRGDIEVRLDMNMCEYPGNPKRGIKKEIRSSFKLPPNHLFDRNVKPDLEMLSENISSMLKEAEKEFEKTLEMDREIREELGG